MHLFLNFLILGLYWSGIALFVQLPHIVDLSSFHIFILSYTYFCYMYNSCNILQMHLLHFAIYLIMTGIRVCDSSEPTMHSGHPVIIESGIYPCADSINYAYLAFQGHCQRVTHSFSNVSPRTSLLSSFG